VEGGSCYLIAARTHSQDSAVNVVTGRKSKHSRPSTAEVKY
jgi:hypothetical protein